MIRLLLVVAVVALAVGLWHRLGRRGPKRRPRSRVERAARLRQRLGARVNGWDVADRLAEAERRRDPNADMVTCYERALKRLDRDRRR